MKKWVWEVAAAGALFLAVASLALPVFVDREATARALVRWQQDKSDANWAALQHEADIGRRQARIQRGVTFALFVVVSGTCFYCAGRRQMKDEQA